MRIFKEILAEAKITLKRAVEIAVGVKATVKITKSLKEEVTPIQQISVSQTLKSAVQSMLQGTADFRMLTFTNVEK